MHIHVHHVHLVPYTQMYLCNSPTRHLHGSAGNTPGEMHCSSHRRYRIILPNMADIRSKTMHTCTSSTQAFFNYTLYQSSARRVETTRRCLAIQIRSSALSNGLYTCGSDIQTRTHTLRIYTGIVTSLHHIFNSLFLKQVHLF